MITRTAKAAGVDDYRHTFKITAMRRGAYVVVNLLGTKGNPGSMATGLFLLQQRGARMTGEWTYRPGGTEVPESEKISFKRM
ncbi:hypothetical protein [Paractinoplanes globisporus]|uniref:Uncharacterized protein n=1 Tax=Paractinoplanes globisporus TaxID=113565 RepID=A0ABW6W9J5_9ACTN|nr:hypothetical protein [Actinoplanes globisporus]